MEHVLSVVVPVYNEAVHLRRVVTQLLELQYPVSTEWIFVDDCSTDGSREILKDLAQTHRFRLLLQEKNFGKGAAVARGFEAASGTLVMIQDADFEYDPRDVPALLEPLIHGRADVVFGSRFKESCPQVHRTFHFFINRTLTLLSNLFSQIYLSDMETCYKIGRADLFKAMNLRSKRFGIEVEIVAYTAKTAARIFELPIHYYPRTHLQGKKITWRDGVAALIHIVRFNWLTPVQRAFRTLPSAYLTPNLSWRKESTGSLGLPSPAENHS
jgi:glycosyltransferase involved in cell wall biosynthesis